MTLYIYFVHFRQQPHRNNSVVILGIRMFCSDKSSLLLAASKCGLFSQDAALESSCAFVLSPRQYNIRLAQPDDAAALVLLDASCWSEHMRADLSAIERRLCSHAAACLVASVKHDELGPTERIIGALYMQRISSIEDLKASRFPSEECADTSGNVLHFYSISALAAFQHLQLGTCLRDFAKKLALCEGISKAVATTRCSHFIPGPNTSADAYLQYALKAEDPTLQFHVSGGANVTGVIACYRPEDYGNLGHAVIAEYDISTYEPVVQHATLTSVEASPAVWDPEYAFKAIVEELTTVLGCSISHDRARDSQFMDLGLDSLGIIMFCNKLCSRFDLKLSPSDIFDHPNANSLVSFVCNLPCLTPSNRLLNRRPILQEPAAVVSIACVFPGGCNSVEDFWLGLCSGRDFTSEAPASWNSETKQFRAGFLQEVQRCQFDPEYFGLSLTELQSMCVNFLCLLVISLICCRDPHQRLLLQATLNCLGNSSLNDEESGEVTGVFVGFCNNEWGRVSVGTGTCI